MCHALPLNPAQLLSGIQLNLVVDDTARAVAADARYDGQVRSSLAGLRHANDLLHKFRLLRDCDIDKRDIIERWETNEGAVVWASARVDGQLFVIRYLESQSNAETNATMSSNGSSLQWDAYHKYLANIKKVS